METTNRPQHENECMWYVPAMIHSCKKKQCTSTWNNTGESQKHPIERVKPNPENDRGPPLCAYQQQAKSTYSDNNKKNRCVGTGVAWVGALRNSQV